MLPVRRSPLHLRQKRSRVNCRCTYVLGSRVGWVLTHEKCTFQMGMPSTQFNRCMPSDESCEARNRINPLRFLLARRDLRSAIDRTDHHNIEVSAALGRRSNLREWQLCCSSRRDDDLEMEGMRFIKSNVQSFRCVNVHVQIAAHFTRHCHEPDVAHEFTSDKRMRNMDNIRMFLKSLRMDGITLR